MAGVVQDSSASAAGAPAKWTGESGRPAGDAHPALAGHRLVDDAEDRHLAIQQADQRAEHRPAGDEGPGAIDRVQHPAEPRLRPIQPELLAQNAVTGESRGEHRAHGLLGAAICDRHRTVVRFLVRGEAGAEQRAHHRAGHVGGCLGRGDQPVQRRRVQSVHRTRSPIAR